MLLLHVLLKTKAIKDIKSFFKMNKFSDRQIFLVNSIFSEAKKNKFTIKIQYSK